MANEYKGTFNIPPSYLREKAKAEFQIDSTWDNANWKCRALGRKRMFVKLYDSDHSDAMVSELIDRAFNYNESEEVQTQALIELVNNYCKSSKFIKRIQATYRKQKSRKNTSRGEKKMRLEVDQHSHFNLKTWAEEDGVTVSQMAEKLIKDESKRRMKTELDLETKERHDREQKETQAFWDELRQGDFEQPEK